MKMSNKVKTTHVPTPVIVVRRLPERSCIEYNAVKRENKYLFSNFCSKDLKLEILRAKIAEVQEETARLFKRYGQYKKVSALSYSCVARKNATSTGVMVFTSPKPVEDNKPCWSTYKAKRDYTLSFNKMKKERSAALALVQAIAARKPRKVYVVREVLVKDRELLKARLQLARERRFLRRHPAKEIDSFPIGCFFEKPGKYINIFQQEENVARMKPLNKSPKNRVTKWNRISNPKGEENNVLLGKKKLRDPLCEEHILFLKFRMRLRRMIMKDPELAKNYLESFITPQMETTGEVMEVQSDIKSHGNVVIAETEAPDKGESHKQSKGFSKLAVSIEKQVFSTMTDRWIKIAYYDWNTQARGVVVKASTKTGDLNTIQMPIELFKHTDHPNLQILLNHRFFRLDVDYRFVMNSSPWQTGAVVAYWTYGHPDDVGGLGSVYSALQRNHVILQAGSSNSAELSVPYHNFNSYMSNKSKQCVYGYIQIKVLSVLQSTDNVTKNVSITCYASPKATDCHGLLARNLSLISIKENTVQGQMQSIGSLCNVGSSMLNTIGNYIDRDNPPQPLQPMSLIPQTMSSFAYTDGISEPINVLRADPRGQRVNSSKDFKNLSQMLRTWGYLSQFTWAFSQKVATQLFTTPVAPLLNEKDYPSSEYLGGGFYSRVYPPIAVISSLAGKCRGNIEYKFLVIANAFYTGSLAISVVPEVNDEELSLYDCEKSLTCIIDIKKTSEVVISAPWNWYNAWMKTKNLYENKITSFARLYVHIVNPLIAIDKVPSSIDVLVFVRGGENFEICQMRTPLLSPNVFTIKPPDNEYLKPYNVEDKWYVTTNHRAVDSKGRYFMTPYIQNISEGFVGFIGVQLDKIYFLPGKTSLNQFWRIERKTQSGTYEGLNVFATGFPGYSTTNADGIVFHSTFQDARDFIKSIKENTIDSFLDNHPGSQYKEDGRWSEVSPNGINWNTAENVQGSHPYVLLRPEDNVRGQMQSAPTITIEGNAPSTSYGLRVYGEKMPDVHGLARRWQHYGSVKGSTCISKFPRDCVVFCKIPVRPRRIFDPITSISYDNRIRSGTIDVFSSAFYLYDGGVRFRLIPLKTLPEDTMMFVQHRFDDITEGDKIITQDAPLSAKDLLDTHYATYSQALEVNPVVSVEVPYYRDTERLLCAKNDAGRPINNGYLYVWIHSATKADIQLEIYFSIADDFQWSVFQGFPAMFDISQLDDEKVTTKSLEIVSVESSSSDFEEIKGQMDDKPFYFTDRPKLRPHFLQTVSNAYRDVEPESDSDDDVMPQGIISDTIDSVTGTFMKPVTTAFEKKWEKDKDELKETIINVNKAAIQITDSTAKITESFQETSKKLGDFVTRVDGLPSEMSQVSKNRTGTSYFMDMTHAGFDYVTHIVYCAMSPTAKTISWAIINLYRNVWGFSFDAFKLLSPIANLWKKAEQKAAEPNQPSGQMEDTDISSICSIMYCSLCSLLKVSVSPPTSWKNITEGLFDFSKYCRGSAAVSQFIKENLTLVKRLWKSFIGLFSVSESKNMKLISGIEDVRLREWCLHTNAILNPAVREKIYTNPLWSEKIFELAVAGRAIVMVLSMDKAVPSALMKLINDNMNALRKLEQDLVNRKIFCGERYEPFCLWVTGKAGTGKTRYLQGIATKLADNMKIPAVQTYHTITINQQYFDGFVGQPSVMIDDFLAVSPTTDPTAAMFVQMKSSCLFNPPYSETKDKSKMVNFPNLLISSNYIDVSNIPGIHDKDAYNRRRDLVLEFEKTNAKQEYTLSEYENLDHVKAYHYPNALDCDVATRQEIKREPSRSYREVLDEFILNRATIYHTRETESFKKRSLDKLKRIDDLGSMDSVQDYLHGVVNVISKMEVNVKGLTNDMFNGISDCLSDVFRYWSKEQREPITVEAEVHEQPKSPLLKKKLEQMKAKEGVQEDPDKIEVLPQGDTHKIKVEDFWPITYEKSDDLTDIDSIECGVVPEPRKRLIERKFDNKSCLHKFIQKFEDYQYDEDLKAFVYFSGTDDMLKIPMSFNVGCCLVKNPETKAFEKLESCLMNDDKYVQFAVGSVIKNWLVNNPDLAAAWPNVEEDMIKKAFTQVPKDYITISQEKCEETSEEMNCKTLPTINERLKAQILKMQTALGEKIEVIGDTVLPKESKWKSVPRAIWKGFITTAKWLYKAICAMDKLLRVALGIVFCGAVGYQWFFGSDPVPNLHPSGDHITIKQRSSMRSKAASLTRPNGGGATTVRTDDDILRLCNEINIDPSADGRLKRIQSNVFTLVGLNDIGEGIKLSYKARCIGLREYEFICIKHYIDHFRANGVKTVAVVYHNAQGLFHTRLDDISFSWTDQGYGVGKFGTLPHMFKNITSYIPSEKSNQVYPYMMDMVTVNRDSLSSVSLECTRLKKPLKVPQFEHQRAWTIEDGFEYKWGGPGKCGSFLFCPKMATPLVAIHTAGVGESRGFAELLLRETFVEDDDVQVDFVKPQMSLKEDGLDIPGDGFVLGHLPKEKAMHIPNETKIIPSEIHGVFSVVTEPAPLSKNDSRLPPGTDPLLEGLKRRCDKPHEIEMDLLNPVYEDYTDTLIAKVKPLKEVGVLTVAQAVEGIGGLPFYDAIERSSSEGYPHVLRRLAGAHGKAWMFEFEEREGRLWLTGIDSKLYKEIEMKEKMRERFIIPASYFAACLKDARIAKEKISIPGKTRLFEMSPVDLTISVRQYFLDFYAAFQNARLDMDHTIGINPDGPEWTRLAEELKWESDNPYILTADYSGYGPRLLHSVQRLATKATIRWYEHHLQLQGVPEEEIHRQFCVRFSLMYEMIHPFIVVRDAVVQFPTGIQSGAPDTVIKNSQSNSLMLGAIYLKLARRYAPQYADMFWYNRLVKKFTNGDDVIMSISKKIIAWFNNETIIEAFAEYNIKMTDAMKSGVVRKYCSLEEATYLKRGFLKHPTRANQYLAPLEINSITDTANWVWKSKDFRAASIVNSEMSCRLAYTRGPEFYDHIVKKITRKWQKKGVQFRAPSWNSLDMHVWENTEGPLFSFV